MKQDAAETARRIAIIDRFGTLSRMLAEVKPIETEHEKLRKEISSWYGDKPGDQAYVAEGQLYVVQVGEKGFRRRITNIAKLYAMLGKAKFLEWATVPLELIDRFVPEEAHSSFLVQSREGSRKITAVAKQVPAAKKGAKAA